MKILSTIDDGAASFNAFKSSYMLARRIGYGIAAIHVDRGQEYSTEFIESTKIQVKLVKELRNISEELVIKIKETAKEADVYISEGVPSEEIINFIKENGVYKIISMGHSTKTLITQSVTKTVLNNTSIPILVTNQVQDFNNILFFIEDSKTAEKTINSTISFLTSLKPAKVTALMVLPHIDDILNNYKNIAEIPFFNDPPDLKRNLAIFEANQRKVLDEIVTVLNNTGISTKALMIYGDTLDAIKYEAQKHDLLIMSRNNIYLSDHSLNILFI
ncbi:MAG: universal stress protein [Nitrospirae bacterium]|nr:universal stress protein [Nitrospirota bacterium]